MNEKPHVEAALGGSGSGPTPDHGKEPTLEEALAGIEAIAAKLEAGDLDLETSLRLYREARSLHALCVSRLSEAERELQILMADGELRTESSLQTEHGKESP
jgi:exodeoxyribonuclease VII small subunit